MIGKMETLLYVFVAVSVALFANYLAALWGSSNNFWSFLLLAVVLVSPFVFITFGIVTSRIGVAIGSGTIDSLLTVSTMLVGLLIFGEWNKLSSLQYVGLMLVLIGLIIIQLSPKIDI